MVSETPGWKRREDALLGKVVSIEPMVVHAVGEAIERFFQQLDADKVYNEAALQHELGAFLRSSGGGYGVEFERPATSLIGGRTAFVKKEIDIAIVFKDQPAPIAIELKCPRNGQYPEQMFKFCQDICFLEQLVAAGFTAGFFVAAAQDRPFHSGASRGIYSHFRGGVPLQGSIRKPTGKRDEVVNISGSYTVEWRGGESFKYACVKVIGTQGLEAERHR